MTLPILLVIVAIFIPSGVDWWIKKRRIRELPTVSDEEFLAAFDSSVRPKKILEWRAHIAKELYVPVDRLRPDHAIGEVKDRYSLVISGDLGVSDLYDDLVVAAKAKGITLWDYPETVKGFIEESLRYED